MFTNKIRTSISFVAYYAVVVFLLGCGNPPPPPVAPPTISPLIGEIISTARNSQYTQTRDKILLDGVAKAETTEEFIALGRAAYNSNSKDEILYYGTLKTNSVDDIVRLAKETSYANNREKFLKEAVMVGKAKSSSDFDNLARTAYHSGTKDWIINKKALYLSGISGNDISDQKLEQRKEAEQQLKVAYEELEKAHRAYVDAINSRADENTIKSLKEVYKAKKKAYDKLFNAVR